MPQAAAHAESAARLQQNPAAVSGIREALLRQVLGAVLASQQQEASGRPHQVAVDTRKITNAPPAGLNTAGRTTGQTTGMKLPAGQAGPLHQAAQAMIEITGVPPAGRNTAGRTTGQTIGMKLPADQAGPLHQAAQAMIEIINALLAGRNTAGPPPLVVSVTRGRADMIGLPSRVPPVRNMARGLPRPSARWMSVRSCKTLTRR